MQQVGRYELVKVVGTGGTAEVFEAYSTGAMGFRRKVAIKRLLPFVADDPSIVRMFFDEARICSALHHSGIVAILDYGVVDGSPFQVMELVDGINAGSAVRKASHTDKPITEAIALYICRQVAQALAFAHAAADDDGPLGIVHRDVKPGNILLSWEGDVKVADFGIAIARVRSERTEAGHFKGTPNFMAPEQLTGKPVDGRADVFALGCVLHTFLAGVSPLASVGSSAGLLFGGKAPVDPTISEDIAELIGSAIQGNVDERLPSMQRMVERLDALVAARGDRDRRSELVEWLAPLRPRQPNARPKPLGVVLVPASGTNVDERTFITQSGPTEDEKTEKALAPATWLPRTLPLVVVVLAVVATVGIGAALRLRTRHEAPAAAAVVASTAPVPTTVPPSPIGSATAGSSEPASSPQAGASSARLPSGRTHTGGRPPSSTVSARASARPPDSPDEHGTGFVRFRAPSGDTTTKIVIDGTPRGFAPRVVELPAGSHQVSFVDENGQTFGTTKIEVTVGMSRRTPRDIDVPSPR